MLGATGIPSRPFASAEDVLDELARLAPGVFLVDIRMAGRSGIELLGELRQRDCYWPAAIMTGHGDIPLAVQAMKLGAIEFLEKPFNSEELDRVISSGLGQLPAAVQRSERCRAARRLAASLSPRQWQVFDGVVEGLTSKEIAMRLGISHRTVESYRLEMMNKLGLRSLVDLVELKPFLQELRGEG